MLKNGMQIMQSERTKIRGNFNKPQLLSNLADVKKERKKESVGGTTNPIIYVCVGINQADGDDADVNTCCCPAPEDCSIDCGQWCQIVSPWHKKSISLRNVNLEYHQWQTIKFVLEKRFFRIL